LNATIVCIQECVKTQINETGLQAGKDIAMNYWFQSLLIGGVGLFFMLWIFFAMLSKGVASRGANKKSKTIFAVHILIPFLLYLIFTTIVIVMLPRINVWLFS